MQSQLKRKWFFGGTAALCVGGTAYYAASLSEFTPLTLFALSGPTAFLFVLSLMAPYIFALPPLQEAIAAHSLSDDERATRILDELDRSFWRRRVSVNIAYLRALIAFQRGDLGESRLCFDQALSLPLGVFTRVERSMIQASARALRAVVAALQGDAAQAEKDIQRAEADPDGMADVPGMAALARGLLLLQQNRVAEARAHVAANRRLLMMAPLGNARPLAHALLRPWSLPDASVYRTQGQNVASPASPTIAWLLKVNPSLYALLSPRDEDDQDPAAGATAAPTTPLKSPSVEAQKLPSTRFRRGKAVLAVWFSLVVVFSLIWWVISSESDAVAAPSPALPVALEALSWLLGPLVIGLLFVSFFFSVRRARAVQRKLTSGDIALARGDDEKAAECFREVLKSPTPLNRATGAQRMAALANLHGNHVEALRWCDEGRKQLTSVKIAGDICEQLLVNEKTLALVLLDRLPEAQAEIEGLAKRAPESLYLPSMRFMLELVETVRTSDLVKAGKLARERSSALMLGAHIDLLAEAAQLAGDESAGRSQFSGLLHELTQDERVGSWIQRVAPALLAQIRARAGATT